MPELECPKCHSEMRTYERSGLTVDQCTGCRGVFLDRGELERLVDAEGAYYERFPAGREREPESRDREPESRDRDRDDHRDRDRDRDRYRDDDDHRDRDRDRYRDDDDHRRREGSLSEMGGLGALLGGDKNQHQQHGRKKHKRESFLSELFD